MSHSHYDPEKFVEESSVNPETGENEITTVYIPVECGCSTTTVEPATGPQRIPRQPTRPGTRRVQRRDMLAARAVLDDRQFAAMSAHVALVPLL